MASDNQQIGRSEDWCNCKSYEEETKKQDTEKGKEKKQRKEETFYLSINQMNTIEATAITQR